MIFNKLINRCEFDIWIYLFFMHQHSRDVFTLSKIEKKIIKGKTINDDRYFLVIFDLPTYHVRQILLDNVWYLGDFLDPPTYPNIGRHLWMFPTKYFTPSVSLKNELISLKVTCKHVIRIFQLFSEIFWSMKWQCLLFICHISISHWLLASEKMIEKLNRCLLKKTFDKKV